MSRRQHIPYSRAVLLCMLLSSASVVHAQLPRIGITDGQFVEVQTGRPFSMHGFNYIRLQPGRNWHGTFAFDLYDGPRADKALAEMAQHGFNVTRVFIDHDGWRGIAAGNPLNRTYMNNFTDFLQRATNHGVYVIPALVALPNNQHYGDIMGQPLGGIDGANRQCLQPGNIDAKAQYVADFCAEIKKRNDALLTSIFTYELCNEVQYTTQYNPYAISSAELITTATGTYNMSSLAEKMQMADDGAILWANTCVAAVKAEDPDAMVSANVFTYEAVGRDGPSDILASGSWDKRFPVRPMALVQTDLDYVDIHLYKFDSGRLSRDLDSIEYDQLLPAATAAGKPLVCGEFGAFKGTWATASEAAKAMREHLQQIYEAGFVGSMHWTYDTDEQEQLWNARSDEGQLFQAALMAERARSGRWGPVVTDEFSVVDPRTAGASLNGLKSEYGGVLWVTSDGVILDTTGVIRRDGSGAGSQAMVPLAYMDGDSIRMSAEVRLPAEATGEDDWVAMGLSSGALQSGLLPGDGTLWIRLWGDGRYEIGAQTISGLLAEGVLAPADFDVGEFIRLDLLCDGQERQVTAWIDGQEVLSGGELDQLAVNRLDGTNYAGLQLMSLGSAADSLSVQIVPEPLSCMVMAVGGCLVLAHRRR